MNAIFLNLAYILFLMVLLPALSKSDLSQRSAGRYIIFLILSSLPFLPNAQLAGTVAGNGNTNSPIDNLTATCTSVFEPLSVTVHPNGNFYIVSKNRLRKVEASTGVITTIAGNGSNFFSGDGGPASLSTLHDPVSVCLDPAGNIYIAEKAGNRIRKIDIQTQIITTIAGTGTAGFSGDGGPAIQAKLFGPRGLITDQTGNLYFADELNNRVRKINQATGIITTIAGNGSINYSGDGNDALNAGLAGPTQVCIDGNGNIIISQCYNQSTYSYIRKINALTGIINTIAGNGLNQSTGDDGPAILANLADPESISVDAQGNIYVAEHNAHRIRKINKATGVITVFAGSSVPGSAGDGGLAAFAQFNNPLGICTDNSGNLYVSDKSNHKIRKIYVNLVQPPPPVLAPSVSITSTSTNACAGPIVFTASVSNASPNMIYQWYRNGINIGTNSNVYNATSLNDGDSIYCVLTAAACNGVITSTSNSIIISGSVTPAINISASAMTVCPGTQVNFTATSINAGNNPSYQWKINGINAGPGGNTWTRTVNSNGENITCVLTADPTMTCLSTNTAYSNQISITVTVGVMASINISSSDNPVCPGTTVNFSANVQNAISPPSYAWKINGNSAGTNSPDFSTSQLANHDQVSCSISSFNPCISTSLVSVPVEILVHPLPDLVLFPADTVVETGSTVQLKAVINGNYTSYLWLPDANLSNPQSLNPQTNPITTNSEFLLIVRTSEGCSAQAKSLIRTERNFYMPNSFTPNGDGLNDVFRIPPGINFDLVEFSVFDRWGKKIFTTKNIAEGWGGKENLTGIYPYFIIGFDGKRKFIVKGLVTLVRR